MAGCREAHQACWHRRGGGLRLLPACPRGHVFHKAGRGQDCRLFHSSRPTKPSSTPGALEWLCRFGNPAKECRNVPLAKQRPPCCCPCLPLQTRGLWASSQWRPGSGPQREESCPAPAPSQGSPGRQGSTLPSSVCLSCCFSFGRPGYVASIMGRRRHLPRIREWDPQLRAQAERQAVNFVVQGTQSPRLARRVHLLLEFLAAAGLGDTHQIIVTIFPLPVLPGSQSGGSSGATPKGGRCPVRGHLYKWDVSPKGGLEQGSPCVCKGGPRP